MTNVRVQPTTDAAGNPRERMIQSALILMGERGIEATSFSQVIEHSGAPRGSIYHHFPGGKAQLVEEATRYAGDAVVNLMGQAVQQADDPAAALEAIVGFWRTVLYDSDFAAGCPVIAATLEGDHSPAARAAARDVFQRWERLYTELLVSAGLPEERARSLGSIAISAVEGAVILSRAERSNAPLERVADELHRLFQGAIEDARTASS
jgi:TetR/AcrR family transcriptional regulator, lmrAB and yxaGH operons repressor